MSKGIRFTDEFKQDAVAQVVERGYGTRPNILVSAPKNKVYKRSFAVR